MEEHLPIGSNATPFTKELCPVSLLTGVWMCPVTARMGIFPLLRSCNPLVLVSKHQIRIWLSIEPKVGNRTIGWL